MYNQAPCGYHSVDATGTFVLINHTELDWLGYERHEVVGKLHFRDLRGSPNKCPSGARERLARLVAGEKLDRHRIHHAPARWQHVRGPDQQHRRDGCRGRFVRTINTLVDITERKAAEVALAAQRNFLQTITSSVPVQLAFFDRDLICRFANASYARWLEWRHPTQLVGMHLSQIARPQDFEPPGRAWKAAWPGEIPAISRASACSPTVTVSMPASNTPPTGTKEQVPACSSRCSTSPSARPRKIWFNHAN